MRYIWMLFMMGCSTGGILTEVYNCGPYTVKVAVGSQHGRNINTVSARSGNNNLVWYNTDVSVALSYWNIDHVLERAPNTVNRYAELLRDNNVVVSLNMSNVPFGIWRNRTYFTPYVYGHYLTITGYRNGTFIAIDSVHPKGHPYDATRLIRAINMWNPHVILIPHTTMRLL